MLISREYFMAYKYKKLANELKQLRGKQKKTMFAKMLGVEYQTYLRYEAGTREPKPPIMKLARLLSNNLPEPEIIIEAHPRVIIADKRLEPPDEKDLDEYIAVPLVEGKIAAGFGRIVREDIQSFVWVYRPEIGRRTNLVAVQIGDREKSMQPTLEPGSIVVIDRNDKKITKKGIYAVRIDDEYCAIKRIHILEDTVFLLSDNRNYPPVLTRTSDPDHLIVGRAIWSCHSFLK